MVPAAALALEHRPGVDVAPRPRAGDELGEPPLQRLQTGAPGPAPFTRIRPPLARGAASPRLLGLVAADRRATVS